MYAFLSFLKTDMVKGVGTPSLQKTINGLYCIFNSVVVAIRLWKEPGHQQQATKANKNRAVISLIGLPQYGSLTIWYISQYINYNMWYLLWYTSWHNINCFLVLRICHKQYYENMVLWYVSKLPSWPTEMEMALFFHHRMHRTHAASDKKFHQEDNIIISVFCMKRWLDGKAHNKPDRYNAVYWLDDMGSKWNIINNIINKLP